MRIRLPMGRRAFFIAAFAFSLVALFPLRLALDWFGLDDRGLAAREASGSIWLGALREAQIGPVPIGDVGARLNSLPVFLGRARVSLVRGGDTGAFAGAAVASRHSFGFEDVTGQLRPGAMLAPIASLDLDDLSAGFSAGQCRRAEGQVRATIAGDLGGIVLPAGLTGTARCDAGALLLPLISQSGMERLDLRLFAEGRYSAELLVRPTDPAVQQRLGATGFVPARGGFARMVEGSF